MTAATILTLNAGSSSIKFAVFEAAGALEEIARGQVENIGAAASINVALGGEPKSVATVAAADHAEALQTILGVTTRLLGARSVAGVGHRITHGGPDFAAPRELDAATIRRLRDFIAWAPLHQPYNLAVVDGARAAFPQALQIGCFDTAFHRSHAFAADAYALPLGYYDKGIRRYGFHGLSYQYVTQRLNEIAPQVSGGRVIVAHLGNGASMCAIEKGRSVASTMGFTALDGLAMGTRCGQIDPGVLLYMLQEEGLSSGELAELLYRRSGLIGLSGISSDMRILQAAPTRQATQAIDYFVHRARSEIGALAAMLGGVDALVFCGGIGENSSAVRARICSGLGFLGIEIDETENASGSEDIGIARAKVLIVPTNEEVVIARAVHDALGR